MFWTECRPKTASSLTWAAPPVLPVYTCRASSCVRWRRSWPASARQTQRPQGRPTVRGASGRPVQHETVADEAAASRPCSALQAPALAELSTGPPLPGHPPAAGAGPTGALRIRQLTQEMWSERLKGVQRSVDVWQLLLRWAGPVGWSGRETAGHDRGSEAGAGTPVGDTVGSMPLLWVICAVLVAPASLRGPCTPQRAPPAAGHARGRLRLAQVLQPLPQVGAHQVRARPPRRGEARAGWGCVVSRQSRRAAQRMHALLDAPPALPGHACSWLLLPASALVSHTLPSTLRPFPQPGPQPV